jgi:SpoVK/Ycf46/Vps4 family AAA+-type ATPase
MTSRTNESVSPFMEVHVESIGYCDVSPHLWQSLVLEYERIHDIHQCTRNSDSLAVLITSTILPSNELRPTCNHRHDGKWRTILHARPCFNGNDENGAISKEHRHHTSISYLGLRMHPLLVQFLLDASNIEVASSIANAAIGNAGCIHCRYQKEDMVSGKKALARGLSTMIAPFASSIDWSLVNTSVSASTPGKLHRNRNEWSAKLIRTISLPNLGEIEIVVLYTENLSSGLSIPLTSDNIVTWAKAIQTALMHRLVQVDIITAVKVLLPAYSFGAACECSPALAIIQIRQIAVAPETPVSKNSEPLESGTLCYFINADCKFSVKIMHADNRVNDIKDKHFEQQQTNKYEIPHGYEALFHHLVSLLNIQGKVRPSGVLLTGCPGVGKTYMAKAIASLWQTQYNQQNCKSDNQLGAFTTSVAWVSLSHFILLASSGFEAINAELNFRLFQSSHQQLVIVDDLHVLEMNQGEDRVLDCERQIICNALNVFLDRYVANSIAVLALCRDSALLPSEIRKVGRLEKSLAMLSPSQEQRERISASLLIELGLPIDVANTWASLTSPLLVGCVASDLQHICLDAYTSSRARMVAHSSNQADATMPTWEDYSNSVARCVPSQLSSLDVTKVRSFGLEVEFLDDWSKIHNLSWREFVGYDVVKKRLFSQIILPWRRWLSDQTRKTSSKPSTLVPASGVLFHGPSGNGKTTAAKNLASSIGLAVINVQTANVLDKWLGGSEKIVRALFARARAVAPVVLFFDEIDALATNRAGHDYGSHVMSRLLSTFLNEMDGISGSVSSNVLVIACTNRIESLDDALLRPGRLEEHVELGFPTCVDIELLLRQRLQQLPVEDKTILRSTAKQLFAQQVSAADVGGVAREIVSSAIKRVHSSSEVLVTAEDFHFGYSRLFSN